MATVTKEVTDRNEVRQAIAGDSWSMAWGDLINEADVIEGTISAFTGTVGLFFTQQLSSQLQKFGQSLGDVSDDLKGQAINFLKDTLKGKHTKEADLHGLGVKAGLTTYHRKLITKVAGVEIASVPLPDNFQPYIGVRIKNPLTISPPSPTPHTLYIINRDTLYCVSGSDQSPPAKLLGKAGDWPGFGAMTYKDGRLFVAEQFLYTVDPKTGAFTRLGEGNWKNTTAMAFLGQTLYIVQNGALHSVNPNNGAYKVLGNVGAWAGHVSMAASGELYIIQSERLWRVDGATGQYVQLGDGIWKEPAYIAAAGSTLLALENSRFFTIDKDTGKYAAKGVESWPKPTAFAAGHEVAFAIESEGLWRININNGSYVKLSDGWAGRSTMVAVPGVT